MLSSYGKYLTTSLKKKIKTRFSLCTPLSLKFFSCFQNSLSPGALGFGQPATYQKGCPKIPAPPPPPHQGHAHWYPMAAAVCQAGASGPSGLSIMPVSPDSELWDIMPHPGVLLWRAPRSPLWDLGPLASSCSQLSSYPLLGLRAWFLFLSFFPHLIQEKMMPSRSILLGSTNTPGTRD